MPGNVIAWCYPGDSSRPPKIYSLVTHSIYTVALVDLFYDRWKWRSRVSSIPDSLLLVTAALHDIGKAWRGYQEAAIAYCNRGKKPSFLLHELLSGLVIAAIASQADKHTKIPTRDLLWRSLTMGVILHHHGMTTRYKTGMVNIIDDLFIRGNLCKYWRTENWCKIPLTVNTLLEDTLPYVIVILQKLQCIVGKLNRGYDQNLIDMMLDLTGKLQKLKINEYKIIKIMKNMVGLSISNPRRAELSAIISMLAGFTAVADSASASFERSVCPTTTVPSGTYAWRVLKEAFGERTEQLLQERMEKASQCLKARQL